MDDNWVIIAISIAFAVVCITGIIVGSVESSTKAQIEIEKLKLQQIIYSQQVR